MKLNTLVLLKAPEQRPHTMLVLSLLLGLSGAGCASATLAAEESSPKVADHVVTDLAAGKPQKLIVLLDDQAITAASPLGTMVTSLVDGSVDTTLRAQMYEEAKRQLLAGVPAGGVDELRTLDHLPVLFLTVRTSQALSALVADPTVTHVYEDAVYQQLDHLALINQPTAAAEGDVGSGTTVAVLDTGLDYTRAAFGNCTAPGVPASCKVAYAADVAADDNSLDDNGHGTNVSGIVLSVAPGARVIGLDVFQGAGAASSDILTAINWVIANRTTYNIVSMNMSLGGGSYGAPCSNSVFASAITSARTAGILSAVASGNDGNIAGMAAPGCVPDAVSVGAVYDANQGGWAYASCTDYTTHADQVTCFSNSASFLTLLAPGAQITAAGITESGTSQATPHVAGAIAVLKSAHPSETPTQIVTRMTGSGTPVNDLRNSIVKPRLDLAAALAYNSAGDVTPPVGSVVINSGAAYTGVTSVNLTLSATDDSGVSQMCISNTSTCSSWQAWMQYKTWQLATAANPVVYVWFKDSKGNANATPYSATIGLDTTAPAGGTLVANPGSQNMVLQWSGWSDSQSGVSGYKLVFDVNPVADCSSGTTLLQSAADLFVHTGLTNGTTYYYRVCASDKVGNWSAGATATSRPATEFSPPNGVIQINGGAAFTNTTAVTLNIVAHDDSGVAQMCISNSMTCTMWETYSTTKSWTLATGSPTTVYAWFKDIYNNANATPVSATIGLDTTAPTDGVLGVYPGNGNLVVHWPSDTDAQSGIATYKLVYDVNPVNSCAAGTTLLTSAATIFAHTGLTNGSTYYYRVCAQDRAGNWSAGATASGKPAPEFSPPNGTIKINGGAAYTNSTSVTLNLSAVDDSGVAQMCISNTMTCNAWETYSTTKVWTLATGSPTSVYAWFKDIYNNANATPVSATIGLDTTAPTDGALNLYPGNGLLVLQWQNDTDGGSGIGAYKLVFDVIPVTTCAQGTTLLSSAANLFVHSGLTNGNTYYYRVCAQDRAGNWSLGSTASGRPATEFNPPNGAFKINAGAAYTSSTSVTLTMAATDDSGVAQMCVSNTPSCVAWEAYSVTRAWTLAAGSPTTVYVWFKDIYNNVNPSPVSASIGLDSTAPTDGAVAAFPGNGSVVVNWPNATDSGSGIASYKLLYDTVPVADCASGHLLVQSAVTIFGHTGLVNGTIYYYRVCAQDRAGNWSAGATVSSHPAPEFFPPNGTVVINAGAPSVNTTSVTLTLHAVDDSGVAQMCVSNTGTCSSWEAYSTSKAWTLDPALGVKTVSVWFKDIYSNVTAAAKTATITLTP